MSRYVLQRITVQMPPLVQTESHDLMGSQPQASQEEEDSMVA